MATETAAPETQPQQASRWEDFVDIFVSPSELFRRRAHAGFGIAFVVLVAVSLLLYYAFPAVSRAFAEAQIAAAAAENPERAQAMGNAGNAWKFFGIFVPLGMFIIIFLMGAATWIAAKITSIGLRFKQALTLNTWVAYVVIVQTLVISVLALMKLNRGEALDPIKDRSVGVLRFMDTSNMSEMVVGLLSRLDLFAVWQLVLTAIAIAAMTGASKGNAYLAAIIVWLIGAIPIMLAAAM